MADQDGNMDEKHLDTQSGRNSSDSCEGNDEELKDIFSSNSSEPSLDKKCVSEASIAEDCSSYENCNTCSDDDVGEKSCTASYAESGMDQSKAINTYENPSCKIEDGYRAFGETEEESSSSIESCAFQSSTVNAGELELMPSPSSLLKNFSIFYLGGVSSSGTTGTITVDSNTGSLNPLEKDTGVESCLNNMIHLVENAQNERCSEIANRSSDESDNSEFETILRNNCPVVTDMTPMNPCPKISPRDDDSVRESLNISEVMTFCKRPNDSEIIFSKKDSTPNNNEGTSLYLDIPPIDKENYPNETEVNQNRMFKRSLSNSPTGVIESKIMKLSSPAENPPIDDDSVRESLNDISEVMTCGKRTKDSEIIFSKTDLTPNNIEETSLCLDIPPIDKEIYPNETEVNQNRTFKRSLSNSPTGVRESKIVKLSSPAENTTSTLKNNDVNLTKRPATPDDNSSPESHCRRTELKKQKIEES